ncbi:hypothetical protein CYMTET_17730 [Cymbomonas tetramitiformis]|uniref:Uncharacterized protein n=1 Tax=Cymbomonas tetramitiformis TaxID=36881 RepID=A0AAE0G9J2_9CHLO|nr:hypothetical protein CYMTET_17730 [Cymbomonas tetramitiformis]
MSTSQVRQWSLVVAEFKTEAIVGLLDIEKCPIPEAWKEILASTLVFSVLFDTSVRFTKHLMPMRLAFFDFLEYKPVTPLLKITCVPDTSGETQALQVLREFDARGVASGCIHATTDNTNSMSGRGGKKGVGKGGAVHILEGVLKKRQSTSGEYPFIEQGISRGGCGAHIEHIKYTAFEQALCGQTPKDWDEKHVVTMLNKVWWFHHNKTHGQWQKLSYLYSNVFGIVLAAFRRCISTRWEYNVDAMANFDRRAAEIRICMFLFIIHCCVLSKNVGKHMLTAFKWSSCPVLRLQMKVMINLGAARYRRSLNWLKGQDPEVRITLPTGEKRCLPPGHRFHEMPDKTLEWQRQLIGDLAHMEANGDLLRHRPVVSGPALVRFRRLMGLLVSRITVGHEYVQQLEYGYHAYCLSYTECFTVSPVLSWDWPLGHPVVLQSGLVWDERFEDNDYDPATFDPANLVGEPKVLIDIPSERGSLKESLRPVSEFTGLLSGVLKLAWVALPPKAFDDLFDGVMAGCRLSLQRHIKWYEEWQRLPHSIGRILLVETTGPAYARAFLNVFFKHRVHVHSEGHVPTLQQVLFQHYLTVDKRGAAKAKHLQPHLTGISAVPNTFRLRELLAHDPDFFEELVRYAYPSTEEDMVVGPLLEKWGCTFVYIHYVLTQQIEGDFSRVNHTAHKNMTMSTISAVNVGHGINSIKVDPSKEVVKAARKAVNEAKPDMKCEADAMHLLEVEKFLAEEKEKTLARLEKARSREAAETANQVKEVCGKCFATKKRVVNKVSIW